MGFTLIMLYYSLIFIILAVILVWGFVLFVKLANRAIKALDIYIKNNTKE